MKRKLIVIYVLCILYATSCSGSDKRKEEKGKDKIVTEFPTEIHTQDATQNQNYEVQEEEIKDSELDKLVESFVFPPLSTDHLNFDEECQGLPLELINQLKEALYLGESDSLIQELNDSSLMISMNDFKFKPNLSEDIDYSEQELNDAIKNGANDYFIYKFDVNGDGTDEIIMIKKLELDTSYYSANSVYLLKESEGYYVFAGHDYLSFYRCFAIFKKDDNFYLVANYNIYNPKDPTDAVGVYSFDGDNSGYEWLRAYPHTYLNKVRGNYRSQMLYEKQNASIVNDIKMYINDIDIDLFYTDRSEGSFVGDEADISDWNVEASDDSNDYSSYNIKAIDVDNDGEDEFFDRVISVFGNSELNKTGFTWYSPKTKLASTVPFTTFSSTDYIMTQQWFKIIAGKTVIFSLYRKNSEDIYLLDTRINENGQTTILLDYIFNEMYDIEFSDSSDVTDTNLVSISYVDKDAEKAFPNDIDQRMKQFAKKVQGDFVAVNYEHKDIPNSLIILAEKALFDDDMNQLYMNTSSCEISKGDFYDSFGADWNISKEDYVSEIGHIYKYQLDHNTYYLEVTDSGGSAKFVNIDIAKESEGELTFVDYWDGLDIGAKVIKYKGTLYFIEGSYNYYSKYTDTINIYKLVPEEMKEYLSINLYPFQFEWEEIYNNHQPYEKSISAYVDSITSDLMDKSPIDDNIQVYLGDETSQFDEDKKLRLKSVGGSDYDYYEIDFNNDGEPEYIERRHWFPSNYTTLYLRNYLYKFTKDRTIAINGDFERKDSTLVQLWFKEIEGKVFTFRLFLRDGYNYCLNVSLVENTNVTQVLSYLIAPKKEFIISTQEPWTY